MSDTLQLLVSGADHLRDQCIVATDCAAGSQESRMHTQQVIQSAYDIAKAAKQLVMLFEWLEVTKRCSELAAIQHYQWCTSSSCE